MPFNFNRYGVRVPAVIVSPYIKPGTVLRPTGATPFDHTSVIATLRKRFGLGAPLTDRDASAPTLEGALTLDTPDNMGPDRLEALPIESLTVRMERARRRPVTDLQKSLLGLSAVLPRNENDAEEQTKRLRSTGNRQPLEPDATAGEAGDIAERRVRDLMERVKLERTSILFMFSPALTRLMQLRKEAALSAMHVVAGITADGGTCGASTEHDAF